jgi:hypothetical protein
MRQVAIGDLPDYSIVSWPRWHRQVRMSALVSLLASGANLKRPAPGWSRSLSPTARAIRAGRVAMPDDPPRGGLPASASVAGTSTWVLGPATFWHDPECLTAAAAVPRPAVMAMPLCR